MKKSELKQLIKEIIGNETVLLDDTLFYIDITHDDEYKCKNEYEFHDCVKMLLSKKQIDTYYGDYTAREFKVPIKNIQQFKYYISGNDISNTWRR